MLDGLEGAAAGSMDRGETDRLLSALDKRVFLLHNVHDKAPVVFQTRWTLSYLQGTAVEGSDSGADARGRGRGQPPRAEAGVAAARAAVSQRPSGRGPRAGPRVARPIVSPGIQQYFVPAAAAGRRSLHAGRPWARRASGSAMPSSASTRSGTSSMRRRSGPGALAVDWATATRVDVATADLRDAAPAGATYEEVPAAGLQAKNYAAWNKDFARWLSQSEKLELMRQRDLKLTSNPGESERDFQVRVRDAQRVARDAAVDAVRKKYAARQAQFEEQRRRAAASVERESAQASQQKLQTGLSVGATILGALFGRKAIGVGSLGRATTAARGVGRSMKETDDIRRANENLGAVEERARALEDEIAEETRRITEQFDAAGAIERVSLAPKRGQVSVQLVGLGWLPDERG